MARHGCSLRAKCKVRVRYSPGVFHNPLGICFLHKDSSNSCQSFHSHVAGACRSHRRWSGCLYIYPDQLPRSPGAWRRVDRREKNKAAALPGKMTTREIAGMRTQHLVFKVNNWIQRFISLMLLISLLYQRSHGLNFSNFSGFASYLSRCQLSV